EEYRIEYVNDRVDTTSTVFMGLTMGCARCHNHKYDPFTQKEYYQLYAYFNNIPEDGRASNYGNSPPWLSAPTRQQQARYAELQNEMTRTERRLALVARNNRLMQRRWERSLGRSSNTQWFPSDNLLLHHSLDEGAALTIKDSVARIDPAKPDEDKVEKKEEKKVEPGFRTGAPKYVAAPTGHGVEFNGNVFFDAGKTADFNFRDRLKDYKDVFTISAWFYPESEAAGAIVTHMQDSAGEKDNNLPKNKGYGLFFINGKVHFNLVNVWADDSFRVETENKLPARQWYHVIAAFDSTQPYERARVYINGEKQKLKVNNGRLFRTFGDANANLRIGAGAGPDYRFKGAIDEVRIYKSLPDEELALVLSCADSLEKIASIPPLKRAKAQRLKMLNAWLDSAAAAPAARQLWEKLRELKRRKPNLEAEFPT
ncbi:MAG: LamG-like jellyroll fold domain-containing protein, partial [Blastocatellia bacterium]